MKKDFSVLPADFKSICHKALAILGKVILFVLLDFLLTKNGMADRINTMNIGYYNTNNTLAPAPEPHVLADVPAKAGGVLF